MCIDNQKDIWKFVFFFSCSFNVSFCVDLEYKHAVSPKSLMYIPKIWYVNSIFRRVLMIKAIPEDDFARD